MKHPAGITRLTCIVYKSSPESHVYDIGHSRPQSTGSENWRQLGWISSAEHPYRFPA